jgi:hypothetical protein
MRSVNKYPWKIRVYAFSIGFMVIFLFCKYLCYSASKKPKTNDDIFQNLFVVKKNDIDIFSTEDDIFFSSCASVLSLRINIRL